jgi:hypothetical protein
MKEKKQKKQSIDTEIATEDGIVEIKKPKVKEAKLAKNRQKYTQKYFNKFAGRSQDSYDKMLQDDYRKIVERAHDLSSITEADYHEVMMITIPDAFDQTSKVNYRLDKKDDDTYTLLYDQALVTILFFGDDVLYYHQANVDHRNGHIAYDVSGEFNYFDVVHMETAIKYDRPINPKYVTLDLEVGLADGTIVPYHLRNHRIHEEYDLHAFITDQEKKFLDTLKQHVRESRKL